MTVIVSALRSPIGKYGGSLKDIAPEELLSTIIQNNLSSVGIDASLIDEVMIGHTKQSAHNPNIARLALLKSGIPDDVSGYTIQMQCGSSMQAIINATMSIQSGQNEVVIAGGVESMSQSPYYFVGNRFGIQPGEISLFDSNIESQPRSQPIDIYGEFSMGLTAEYLAKEYKISREEQDIFALGSQQKARDAINKNKFTEEIVPITLRKKGNRYENFAVDEFPRDTSISQLEKLRPVFKDEGTVTAGNSTGRNDGASALLLMSKSKAEKLGLKPLAKIRSFASAGVHPEKMGIGPVKSTKIALKKAGLTFKDLDLIELNEAFAAQSIAVLKEWDSDGYNVNLNGGAIALGHPLGATGARIMTTLTHEMNRENYEFGLATMCIAGGQGISMIIENIS